MCIHTIKDYPKPKKAVESGDKATVLGSNKLDHIRLPNVLTDQACTCVHKHACTCTAEVMHSTFLGDQGYATHDRMCGYILHDTTAVVHGTCHPC